MYNTDLPTRAELPTAGQLVRSTVIAIVTAIVILVTIILPAEYAIDPTGIGRWLGLAEMGEIKEQLAREAEEDRLRDRQQTPAVPQPDQRSGLGGFVASLFIGSAVAQTAPDARNDEMTIRLTPGQGAEIKLAMKKGAQVQYEWSASGKVNYDLHGDGPGNETSYRKGRAVEADKGTFVAAFDGNHGWFWRNRARAHVEVTLRTGGSYASIKRVM